jgi:hypothetical protein
MAKNPTITDGIDSLQKRFTIPPMAPGRQPVFLLSAGWRSGSTLVQRLLTSDSKLLMWGEPYDHCGLIRSLSGSLSAFAEPWPPGDPKGHWPPPGYFVDPADPPTGNRWIANAYPHPADLLASHRAFFDRLFDIPARAAGFRRWGIKAVRLTGEHAGYLQVLYPDARFIFLHRNPWDAWSSYRRRHDERQSAYWWFHEWPDQQVATPKHFARIWGRTVESFLAWAPVLDATIVAYEDVVSGEALPALSTAAEVKVRKRVLNKRIGGALADRSTEWVLAEEDAAVISAEVAGIARRFGYVGPTGATP